ncbi:PTS transporter subunit EIIC [Paraburkholderia bannensis]|uniref:PTS transporter subunit EIIC n=1 Tax=Paraburkholderia bannensis TaxID=765414 RepID=UPI002ABE962F|nr:PTS transporter subunit EIIC [Paraburkholderia bannensis]
MVVESEERSGVLAEAILDAIGGARNVSRHTHCMTRLRIVLMHPEAVDHEALKRLPAVLGVVAGNPLQVVIGPGTVKQVSSAFDAALGRASRQHARAAPAAPTTGIATAQSPAAATTTTGSVSSAARLGNQAIRRFLRRIASIFTPLIPALIGAGLVNALAGLLLLGSRHAASPLATHLASLSQIASIIGSAFFAFLIVQVGMNAAREFDGTASLGGAAASIMILPAVNSLHDLPWPGHTALYPGQGGLIGALLAGALVAGIERYLRTRLPSAIETLATPTLALLVSGAATLLVLMPVADLLTQAVGRLTTLLLHQGGMPAAFLLASWFIGLLMFGLHQALIPIHAQLIAQTGYTALFPILAMSGCGQAGSGIALYFRVKDATLKRRIRDTLPTCLLGVSEPLLYSVTLPLGRPLITSSIGGGIGALVLGYCASHGNYIGATTIGPANLMLIPLVTGTMGFSRSVAVYCLALVTAYASAFILTWFFGLPKEQRLKRTAPAPNLSATEPQKA